jgi:hypothetical protein
MAYLEHTMMSQTPGTSMHMPQPLAASGVTFRRQRGNFVPPDDYSAASIFQTAQARTPSYQGPRVPQRAGHAEVAEGYQAELAALQRRALRAEQLCEQQAALISNMHQQLNTSTTLCLPRSVSLV